MTSMETLMTLDAKEGVSDGHGEVVGGGYSEDGVHAAVRGGGPRPRRWRRTTP